MPKRHTHKYLYRIRCKCVERKTTSKQKAMHMARLLYLRLDHPVSISQYDAATGGYMGANWQYPEPPKKGKLAYIRGNGAMIYISSKAPKTAQEWLLNL